MPNLYQFNCLLVMQFDVEKGYASNSMPMHYWIL